MGPGPDVGRFTDGRARCLGSRAAWQWIFWINIPIGLIVIPLVHYRIPKSFGAGTAVDGAGVVLVTGATLGLVFGLMQGNVSGWGSPEVLAALGTGLVLAAGFVICEPRAQAPMVPMRLFGAPAFSSGVGACFLDSAGMYGVLFFLPQFLQTA